jgi:spore maturation protein SpmB
MQGMQELNPVKDTASNAQIMFLVLNTSGLTLIPITIMTYRAQQGAVDPSDVFLPILLATFFSTLTGIIVVSIFQKINLFDRVIFAYLGTMILALAGLIYYFSTISQEQVSLISTIVSNVLLFSVIVSFITSAFLKKINVYEAFIEGAKEGFSVAITIIPYLVAILVAIGVFRASGSLGYTGQWPGCSHWLAGLQYRFCACTSCSPDDALKWRGARGMMVDILKTYGADSFAGRTASILNGATETTFYVLAVYFGSVGIRKTRNAVTCGLLADLAGVIAAISLAYLFFH